ncbi:MAG TPA: carbohydrate-binding family 9-like protein, partial [Gemmatimonadales bacterium]|nr:carbohydrate-binding family 9-like protein [Gemmatimonadales bacterium]
TVWDLFLPKPYRDGGQAVNGWDIAGLRVAVALQGTLNNPHDRDHGWTAELAIPWSAFADSVPVSVPPHAGDNWRVNFSRVEWDREVITGEYRPRRDSVGGLLPEHNWVWSPQGVVNMHLPELWGVVQFGGKRIRGDGVNDSARWALRRVYYAEREFHRRHGAYTGDLGALALRHLPGELQLRLSADGWEGSLPRSGKRAAWHIRADGLVWRE